MERDSTDLSKEGSRAQPGSQSRDAQLMEDSCAFDDKVLIERTLHYVLEVNQRHAVDILKALRIREERGRESGRVGAFV